MAVDNIYIEWKDGFIGTMSSPTGKVILGDQDGGMQPYHLLFGALGSCFYATFLSIADKKRCSFDSANVEISGVKRTGEVATLETVFVKLVVKNPSNEIQLIKSAELGAKFCSIYQTLSKVAEMTLKVYFE
ncbi:MAG: OsmC family protein [Firmicutes bacterium]|nr:OsmC family protein [Bacillota bacterium]